MSAYLLSSKLDIHWIDRRSVDFYEKLIRLRDPWYRQVRKVVCGRIAVLRQSQCAHRRWEFGRCHCVLQLMGMLC